MRRLAFLDALRGIAALWVVLFHLHEDSRITAVQEALPGWLYTPVFEAGYLGVPVFFALSGFVIAHSIGSAHVTGRYVARFALRRVIRLDLPYWASMAVALAYAAAKARLRPDADTGHVFTAGDVVAHMLYLQDFLQIPNINWVYWTLCFEIQFYLLFCALLWLAQRFRREVTDLRPQHLLFAGAAVVSLVWPLVPALQVPGLALVKWYGFLVGAFACWALRGTIRTRWFMLYAVLLSGIFGLTRDPFVAGCFVAGVGLLLVGRAGGLGTWLNQPWLQFLGRISYSLYLLHIPVTGALYFVMRRWLGHSTQGDALVMLVAVGANCLVAWVFWRLVERPSTALARRVRQAGDITPAPEGLAHG